MPESGDIAAIGALIGERARAAMIVALLDGQSLTAKELAEIARITPQTACFHLGKLSRAGLIAAEAFGRLRFFRLSEPRVGKAIRALMAIAPAAKPPARSGRASRDLRFARSCYGHLAGRLGVALAAALVGRGLVANHGGAFEVTGAGRRFFGRLGIDLDTLDKGRRELARPCLDWTEGAPHLAGSLGDALLDAFLARGWLARMDAGRSLRPTPAGARGFARLAGLDLERLRISSR